MCIGRNLCQVVGPGRWDRVRAANKDRVKPMKKKRALGAAILLVMAGGARADGPNPIEIRQVWMDLETNTFAGIRAILAANGDVKTLEKPARAMQRWATMLPLLFPKGSETGNNTNALPEIWSDAAGFQKVAATAAEAVGKMADLAKAGDADGVAAQVRVVANTCGACHRAYRAR